MARYGIIENNIITDIIVADGNFIESFEKETVLLENDEIKINWGYENGEFINNDPGISDEEWIQWRNSQLNSTDFIAQTPDYPNRDAWLTYRQELRDWPSTAGFPETKPTKPE